VRRLEGRHRDAQPELVALATWTTDDPHAPSHIQILTGGRDEHHYRWAAVGDALQAMGRVR
jgi:hypothetical protein